MEKSKKTKISILQFAGAVLISTPLIFDMPNNTASGILLCVGFVCMAMSSYWIWKD